MNDTERWDCQILIYDRYEEDNYETIVLGDIFADNYYLIFDFDNHQIGLNGYFSENTKPSDTDKDSPFKAIIVFIVIILIAAIAGPIIAYYTCYKKKRERYESHVSMMVEEHKYQRLPKNLNNS